MGLGEAYVLAILGGAILLLGPHRIADPQLCNTPALYPAQPYQPQPFLRPLLQCQHSFATHLSEDGCDIRTVQEHSWGHKDVSMTMVYTYVLQRGGQEVRRRSIRAEQRTAPPMPPLTPATTLSRREEEERAQLKRRTQRAGAALVPPKPKEFAMAVRIWTWRAVFGT